MLGLAIWLSRKLQARRQEDTCSIWGSCLTCWVRHEGQCRLRLEPESRSGRHAAEPGDQGESG